MKEKRNKKPLVLIMGVIFIFVGAIYYVYDSLYSTRFGTVPESALIQVPADELPEDTLYITQGRRQYQHGDMTLLIPAIGVDATVGESTDPEILKKMPGLYEFAQLPGEGDVNVSIAGHRDIYDMVFYSLDQVKNGDYLYLVQGGSVYQYLYKDTKIVKPNDWSVVKPQGFSCLTLTTCDPIGTSLNRLIVRAELVAYQPFDSAYPFVGNVEENITVD